MPLTRYASNQSAETPSPLIIFNWFVKKAILKKKFPFLNDRDLHYEVGREDELYENLRTKLDISREELQNIIAEI